MTKNGKKGANWGWRLVIGVEIIFALWLIVETGLRVYVEMPLKTDFYSSIPRELVRQRQVEIGVRTTQGPGWVHMGWIADPDRETYRVERHVGEFWQQVDKTQFGYCLLRETGGSYRVLAISNDTGKARLLGNVDVRVQDNPSPLLYKPVIAGPWQVLFRPLSSGNYINDHAVYRDAGGDWRLVGITSKSDGDYNQEKYLAVGTSKDIPPAGGMQESTPVADFGDLAWAPHVISERGTYYMFWSPHRLERMTSADGISWGDRQTVMPAPYHKFFRDAMIFKTAGGQWLLYSTARGLFFSQVDRYQSFDLKEWQYTGTALSTGWGSERNSPFASTESPFVMEYKGRYYLSVTYNNDTFFWNGILLPFKIWLDRDSYNDTLIFNSDNPYDFGNYNGSGNASSLISRLKAHAPEYVYVPDRDAWYITTAGWPWISSITSGEAAIAPLKWEAVTR
jgi:hypothetical protein